MLIGHEDKVKIFKNLIDKDSLSHGYLFFGEPQVGKSIFALALANALEKDKFDVPETILSENLLIKPEGDSIGIDQVRQVRQFLSQRVALAKRRSVIIDQADKLTPQAQNAVLKIAEEPPEKGLIILVVTSPDSLLPTLRSRVQSIHFGNVSQSKIINLLEKGYGVAKKKADDIASLSLGKPGLAVSMVNDERYKEGSNLAIEYLKGKKKRRDVAERLTEEPDLLDIFISSVLAELSKKPLANYKLMSKLLDRVGQMQTFSTNKRLQLESALWI